MNILKGFGRSVAFLRWKNTAFLARGSGRERKIAKQKRETVRQTGWTLQMGRQMDRQTLRDERKRGLMQMIIK